MTNRSKRILCVLCAVVAFGFPLIARADTQTYTFGACIDGEDLLIVQGNTLQWKYISFTPVGFPRNDCPTTKTSISTTFNGDPVLSTTWQPTYPSASPSSGTLSFPFAGLDPAFPSSNIASVTISIIQARESLTISQFPSTANSETLILDFNDTNTGGAAIYTVKVTVITNIDRPRSSFTRPTGINDAGWIVGISSLDDGFLLRRGNYTSISSPHGNGEIRGINSEGEIVGTDDSPIVNSTQENCFIRDDDGNFSPFAVFGSLGDLDCNGINNEGDTVGSYVDGSRRRGWLRTWDGKFRHIDVPLSFPGVTVSTSTEPYGINYDGDVVGVWSNGNDADEEAPAALDRDHCFLRHQGKYHNINFPGASGTICLGINNEGDIVGSYLKNGLHHGFVLSEGKFHTIDLTGVVETLSVQGINDEGWMVGVYRGTDGFDHGFKVRK